MSRACWELVPGTVKEFFRCGSVSLTAATSTSRSATQTSATRRWRANAPAPTRDSLPCARYGSSAGPRPDLRVRRDCRTGLAVELEDPHRVRTQELGPDRVLQPDIGELGEDALERQAHRV